MSQFDLDAKARDIGLEGFNAPAELNALHVWQLAGRKATIRLKRDREFADSPVEEAVSSEPVSEAKFPASWENTGNFVRLGLRVRLLARNQ